jgi:hypothetical protein
MKENQIITKIAFRLSRPLLFVFIMLIVTGGKAQTPDTTLTKLFQNSYKVIDAMRLSGGIYLDALAINVGNKPVALAANGVGLYALCIADSMYKKTGDATNWDANAENKALATINEWIRLKNTPGATNINGLFHRYLNPSDGSWVWVTEHSTIDNAIMAAGFLFCRNYFRNNTEIVAKTTELLNSMDFTAAIPPSGDQMYMILDDNGKGSALTSPFNEYMVLAWFAKNSNASFAGYNRAQTYWNNKFSTTAGLPKYNYPSGNATLSSGNTYAQPSFHVQFCYYYCNFFANNTDYMTSFENQVVADKAWWQAKTGQQIAWGCGAGELPGGGYSADAVNSNPNKIVSPHIMAGFSPVNTDVRSDLISLYDNGKGKAVYKIPGTLREFLWRYNYTNTGLRTSYVQAVDFSTMLYGLAALPEYLGPGFFSKYNDFDAGQTSSSHLMNNKVNLRSYPNPSSEQTIIEFDVEKQSRVVIDICTLNGQTINQLVNREMDSARHSVVWKTTNGQGRQVPPGIYLCRMLIDNQLVQTIKMQVLNGL